MKVKLVLIVVLLFSFAKKVYSQDYIPFLNNSSWIIMQFPSHWEPDYRILQEGTPIVIGNQNYIQFNDPYPQSVNSVFVNLVNIREDISQRKVYRLINGVENLIYDFNLVTGDVISQYGYTFTATVDQVNVNGGTRKRIKLQTEDDVYLGRYRLKQVWIEGVGSEAHSLFPDRNMYNVAAASGGVKYYTYCSFQNGTHIYGTDDCTQMQLTLTTEIFDTHKISFTPNPMVTEMTINSSSALQNATLKLYNLQGQIIKEFPNLNDEKNVIIRGNLSSGLYFAQLFEDGKPIVTTKLIVN
jgi:Secretion system C-terminal sorting domain